MFGSRSKYKGVAWRKAKAKWHARIRVRGQIISLGYFPDDSAAAAIAAVVWVLVVSIWRYVSLASITASMAFPIVLILAVSLLPAWNFADLWPLLIAAIAIPLMVIIRHRKNIKRLLAGTEDRIWKEKP